MGVSLVGNPVFFFCGKFSIIDSIRYYVYIVNMKDNDGSEQDNPELFGTEIDYHRYWKDMYEKEHKLRLEAEGETHLVKAVGMNSPEMKAANVKIDEMRKELDRIKLENNNLFTRVADSLEVNEYHQNLNSNLQVRIAELEEDNKRISRQVEDHIERIRKAGL
tara:strand:- start:99 stop:587 length:489 start_codon:yes stop_codon:yes gene_type:complete